eukprot:347550_1
MTNTNNNNMTPMSKSHSLNIISSLRETIETHVSDKFYAIRFIYPSPQPQLIAENKYDNDKETEEINNEIYKPIRRWSLSDNLEEYDNKDINSIDLKYSLIDNIMKISLVEIRYCIIMASI